MPSPDVRRYVDLTLLDASSQTIFQNAIDYARYALPEFQPREGTIEVVLLQAMALQMSELIVSLNRVPGAITEVLLRLLDVDRQEGAFATAVVKFTGVTTTSFTVPAGTRMYYLPAQDSTPLLLETVEAVTASHIKTITAAVQTVGAPSLITVTTSTRHGLVTGDVVSLSETGIDALNVVTKAVTVLTPTSFTVTANDSVARSVTVGRVTPASTIPATGFATVSTTVADSSYNGIVTGTVLQLLTVVPAVASTVLATTLLGGAETESDDEYFTRATATLARLSTALVTAPQTAGFVLEQGRFPDVYRATVADTTSVGRVGNIAGSMLVVASPVDASPTNLLSGVGDGTLAPDSASYGVLDQIFDAVSDRVHGALDVTVSHPAFLTVNVAATVKLPDGLTAAAVEAACQDALEVYLSANSWPWDTTIRVNELIVLLRNTTITTGTLVSPATNYVVGVSITPAAASVPSTSTANRFAISTITRASNTVTVTVAAVHGISFDPGETLYVQLSGVTDSSFNTAGLVPAVSASSNQFAFAQVAANGSSSGGHIVALAKKTVAGDIVILDPAPLVVSGTHSITTVA